MARRFRGDGLSDGVTLGDVTAARFLELSAWSVLAHFRVEEVTGDQRVIISKYEVGGNRQFRIRVESDSTIDIAVDDAVIISTNAITLNKWYVVAVTNDGTGGAGGVLAYVVDMGLTYLNDATSGTHGGDDAAVTAEIRIGKDNTAGGGNPMEGDIAYPCYVNRVVTKDEISQFVHRPHLSAARWIGDGGVSFFLPLGLGSPEPDYSGNGNSGTLIVAPTIGDDPPIAPWWGMDIEWEGAFTAAAGGGATPTTQAILIG